MLQSITIEDNPVFRPSRIDFGRITLLIGGSGVGKSLLLKMIWAKLAEISEVGISMGDDLAGAYSIKVGAADPAEWAALASYARGIDASIEMRDYDPPCGTPGRQAVERLRLAERDLRRGALVLLDTPDAHVDLREIKPRMRMLEDAAEEGNGQLIVASTHPEILNMWAPSFGLVLLRDGARTRVESWRHYEPPVLTSAEVWALGWYPGQCSEP